MASRDGTARCLGRCLGQLTRMQPQTHWRWRWHCAGLRLAASRIKGRWPGSMRVDSGAGVGMRSRELHCALCRVVRFGWRCVSLLKGGEKFRGLM